MALVRLSPDFVDKYAAYEVARAKASGASAEAIDAKTREMRECKVMYDKPLMNIAITFMEPLPVAGAITLVSAAVLRKRSRGCPIAKRESLSPNP